MKSYEVLYRVEGVIGTCSIVVEAPDVTTARRIALSELQSQAGFIGKTIRITHVRKI